MLQLQPTNYKKTGEYLKIFTNYLNKNFNLQLKIENMKTLKIKNKKNKGCLIHGFATSTYSKKINVVLILRDRKSKITKPEIESFLKNLKYFKYSSKIPQIISLYYSKAGFYKTAEKLLKKNKIDFFSETNLPNCNQNQMLKEQKVHISKNQNKRENLFGKEQNKSIRAVLKWAGGKSQIIKELKVYVPEKYNKYIEPFFGGGSFFFALQPKKAVISDVNTELINFYQVLAELPEELIKEAKQYPNNKDFFYEIRKVNLDNLNKIQRAARVLFLNKTCFNGLYRVNKQGEFNVPYGNYKDPTICDDKKIFSASKALKDKTIEVGNYKEILQKHAAPGDFIYLDPPYLPVSKYSDFKRYTAAQFSEQDHVELGDEVKRLRNIGCYVLLSNSNHQLVHKLYDDCAIKVLNTKRSINCKGSLRNGEDVIVYASPKKIKPEEQTKKYPPTKYMGSKQSFLDKIWDVCKNLNFNSVLDPFSGSGVVSYMFKAHGKRVFSNDYMTFSSLFAKTFIENNKVFLEQNDVEFLLSESSKNDFFVSKTFQNLYFDDESNLFIDKIRCNMKNIESEYKKSIAMVALIRSCMKKRARGIFTYTGFRYDDGRKDLKLSLKEHFIAAVQVINDAIFDNHQDNKAFCKDVLNLNSQADLVYLDPPYFSSFSDNEYVRRYHFVEGLAKDWKGVEIQQNTKTKKIKNYSSIFSSMKNAYNAFDILFSKYQNSILVVSYSSNCLPKKDEMMELLGKYKKNVSIFSVDHKYSFGNQNSHKNNNVQEYIFLGV